MMEKQLKCVLLLSLKEISLRRLAAILSSGSDMLACISNVRTYACYVEEEKLSGVEEERRIGDKIQDKMLKLKLPKSLTNQMMELVGPMSSEIRRWKYSLLSPLRLCNLPLVISPSDYAIRLPGSVKLCWTTAGTINYRKTVEELFRCDNMDVEERYQIACCYCLEARISLYWEELSEERKVFYGSGKNPLAHLTYCWPYILKGKHSELDHLAYNRYRISFNQFAFENLARSNETAAEYFFQKLSHEEREATLMTTAHAVMSDFDINRPEDYSNVWFYLLSLMTPEQQMEIIKTHPINIFLCFLRSQLQGLFQENAGLLWALLPPSSYIALLEKILKGYPIIYLPNMIKEFFMGSPQDFKTCFVYEKSSVFPKTPAYRFVQEFFRFEDSESIKALFRNVDAAIRVKLVRRNILLFLDFPVWHMAELCLREAKLSKEEMGRLKDDFLRFLERRGKSEISFYRRLLVFLSEADASSG